MARLKRIEQIDTPDSAPRYELRVRRRGPVGSDYEVWQLPAAATPQVTSALRLAGLRGRNLELVEYRVLKRLSQAGIKLGRSADARRRGHVLDEDLALTLGLLFRALAPMRSRDNMRAVGGRHRGHGTGGSRLLARHGHAPQAPSAGPDGAAVPADRAKARQEEAMKITFLQLNGYRGYESYALRNLGGVNLLVGKSNSRRVSMLGTMSLLIETVAFRR